MDVRRGTAATAAGAGAVLLGAAAWALAATSMAAVQAAEARALGPGHTADMPGEDELALYAHDSRLAALLVVACGLALAVAPLARRRAVAAWLGGAAAAVVANATLGRAVDDGPLLPAAVGLVVAVALGAGAGVAAQARRRRGRSAAATEAEPGPAWPLLGAGALAAGTLPVLGLQGTTSERYAAWLPAELVTGHLVTALALAGVAAVAGLLLAPGPAGALAALVLPTAAAAVLVERSGSGWQPRDDPWQAGVVLALASAPLVLVAAAGRPRPRRAVAVSAAALAAVAVLLASQPAVLVPVVLVGGGLGMLLTGPAGAYVNYDGLPVVGGGALLGALLLLALLGVRGDRGRADAVAADAVAASGAPARP